MVTKALYCLIGDPVEHSLSPFIMNRAFSEHGLEAAYHAMKVGREDAEETITGLRALGFVGANVTYPLKEAALSLAHKRSDAVDTIRAVNTLRFTDRDIVADNTDAEGTVRALETFGNMDIADKRVAILGGGGAARAAAYGLLMAHAGAVTFALRDTTAAARIVDRYRGVFAGQNIDWCNMESESALGGVLAEVDIIINATPMGMSGHHASSPPVGTPVIRSSHCCFDFVYHPRLTSFIEAAKGAGAQTVDGLALLVAQAQSAFRLWTGKDFDLTDMYEAASDEIESRESAKGDRGTHPTSRGENANRSGDTK